MSVNILEREALTF